MCIYIWARVMCHNAGEGRILIVTLEILRIHGRIVLRKASAMASARRLSIGQRSWSLAYLCIIVMIYIL